MEDYKKKYEDALERCKKEFNFNNLAYSHEEIKQRLEHVFPELKNNEDEKIRKEIVSFLRTGTPYFTPDTTKRQNWANWLEKQGEESKRLYVRFGEIPEDECSGVYHAGELVGKEEGVSVYDAKIDNHNNVLICIPLPINENTLDTFQNLVEYDNRNCYLVKGTCVGKGSDNEPIIRNVSIVKRIDNYRIKESDKKSDQNLDNFCKTCKDEQKPVDKVDQKQNVVDIISDLEKYFATTTKEQQEKDWEEIEAWEKKYFKHDRYIEQKPTDKVEPKFKVGDWVVKGDVVAQILDKQKYAFVGLDTKGNDFVCNYGHADSIHLWTIQDAKDGDVLVIESGRRNNECLFIFKDIACREVLEHCYYRTNDSTFSPTGSFIGYLDNNYHPATKEQRDLLFQKMHEAGYEWDVEKKELKKIEQKPEIKDDVLSRFAFYQYDDDTIYLSSLFVRESDRGRGYGSKVLKAAEEVAKTFGISKIRLKVERNTWMEEWYEKNGYEYLSSEGKYDWLENRAIDIKPDKIEQKPDFCHHEVDFSNCSEEYRKAYYDGWNNCNQQHAQLEAEQKPTWSEEDEKYFNVLYKELESYIAIKGYYTPLSCADLNWLKSLKERYTWKPSDEQMEALKDGVRLYKSTHFDSQHYKIESLYEDLKKLKGE